LRRTGALPYDPTTPNGSEAMPMKRRIKAFFRRFAPALGFVLACLALMAEVTLAVLVFG
jgi:hypothetical protein